MITKTLNNIYNTISCCFFKALLKKTENFLPLLVQNDNSEAENDDKFLKEFILCNLFDPSFPNFVERIEKILNEVVYNEIN